MNEKPAKTLILTWLTLVVLAASVSSSAGSTSPTGASPSVTLAWALSPNANVTNYNLYYGGASGVYTNEIAAGLTYIAAVSGLVPGATYYFAVTAEDTNGVESAYSNEIDYQAPASTAPPVIDSQPTNQATLRGGNAAFSVTASGAPPLSYQWSMCGKIIDGATNASLTMTDVQFSDTGNYAVLVSNNYGSVLSANAELILATLPGIALQPASQSVESGCSANLKVQAFGTAPLSYQWFNSGVLLTSATNSILDLPVVETSELGRYRVVVNNAFGAVTSAVAVLALGSPPEVGPCIVQRFSQGGVRINVSVVTSNDTAAQYDSLTVIAVSPTSANGGVVSMNGPWIYYAPPGGEAVVDTFTYTVSDGHCGTAEGTVTVMPHAKNTQPMHFAMSQVGDGSLQLSFDGAPGGTYQIQYTESLSSPHWLALTNQAADDFGVFRITEWPTAEVQALFYRAGTVLQPALADAAP